MLCMTQSACTFLKKARPSVLVIAVEGLGFEDITCSNVNADQIKGGFEAFCNEAVRFSHAYSPSPMSVPSLASLLTAKYPREHKVYANGSYYLKSGLQTLGEVAFYQNFATSFFSGGPPVFRKSGFHQGFQHFDDRIRPNLKSLYRPVSENFKRFTTWLDSLTGSQSFFSMIYLPDVQFEQTPTTNKLGVVRESSPQAQLQEIDESIADLVSDLKRRKKWDKTHVVLVGLNSRIESPRIGELAQVNIFSDRTHVALFIKPARKTRDGPFNWKVDRNVSLVDVGVTLFEILEGRPYRPVSSQLEIVSLLDVLQGPEATWKENRPIMVSSHWPVWTGIGSPRMSIRKGHLLYVFDKPIKIYNTLTDRLESSPIPESESRFTELKVSLDKIIPTEDKKKYSGLTSNFERKVRVTKGLWGRRDVSFPALEELEFLTELDPKDYQLAAWSARQALRDNNWEQLLKMGRMYKNKLWSYVGRRNLSLRVQPFKKGCNKYFSSRESIEVPRLRECDDLLFIALLNWVYANPADVDLFRERFLRQFESYMLGLKIYELNYVNELNWDLPLEQPTEPNLTELYLRLPENSRYMKIVARRVLRNFH